jgi:hypothetical protein
MYNKVSNDGKVLSEAEGIKRLNDKIKELKKRNVPQLTKKSQLDYYREAQSI